MELISGTPLYQYLRDLKSQNDTLSIMRIWQRHVKTLVELHDINYKGLNKHFENAIVIDDEKHYLDHDMRLWQDIVKDHEVSHKFTPILRWLDSQIGQVPLQKYDIVHRDFYLGNLVHHSNKLSLIDWGVSYLTDFRLDLGYTLMRISLDVNQYISRADYLDMYEKAASIRVQNIESYQDLINITQDDFPELFHILTDFNINQN